jgi:hypothetical protein
MGWVGICIVVAGLIVGYGLDAVGRGLSRIAEALERR